jgi:rRNA maturation protein Nop10
MSEPVQPATIALPSSCPRCGKPMVLELPADVDPADAQRLARLILCDACMAGHTPALEPPEPPAVRWPMADP